MRKRRFGAPPPVRMHVCWRRWWPTRSRDFWGEVGRLVRDRRVRWSDKVRVRDICAEVERMKRWTA